MPPLLAPLALPPRWRPTPPPSARTALLAAAIRAAAEAFALSRIDESWQAEFWGVDEDAAALEAAKQRALLEAEQFYALCR